MTLEKPSSVFDLPLITLMSAFLIENIKFIVHMRHRLHVENKLGLCLGAGVSTDFSIPSWKNLIQRIAEHSEVQGVELLKISTSLTEQCQFLYQKFHQRAAAHLHPGEDDVLMARRIGMQWLRIVHECLYRDAKTADADLRRHPYLWSLLPLIKQSAMTINYNFDDTVERALYLFNNEKFSSSDDKGFEVAWQPSSQFRRNRGVIYHPNGFLPHQTIDGFSEQIVFMEQEFADQLVDLGGGHSTSLVNHFSKQTIIFIGLSLSDANLKHSLYISAKSNPGNFHYRIYWCGDEKPSMEVQDTIRKANFSIYKLVTLFLSTKEIEELAALLVLSNEDFNAQCDTDFARVRTEYRYYLTGAVGCGKTTALENLRSIGTFDEWVDRKHFLLGRPHSELSAEERQLIDGWINQQFRKKNRRVCAASTMISLIDRSPIDPLYFVANKESEFRRAQELLQWMVPSTGPITKIAAGHLIIFKCDPRVLRLRLASRDKTYTEEQLVSQIETIDSIWKDYPTTIIDTTNMSVAQVVSKVLETILFTPYQPIDIHEICRSKATDVV